MGKSPLEWKSTFVECSDMKQKNKEGNIEKKNYIGLKSDVNSNKPEGRLAPKQTISNFLTDSKESKIVYIHKI